MRLQRHENRLAHVVEVVDHFVIGHAQDAIAGPRQKFFAAGIMGEFFVRGMRRAVDFHDQSLLPANKIHEIRPDRLLAHEFIVTELASAQFSPQLLFRGRLDAAKVAAAISFKETQAAHDVFLEKILDQIRRRVPSPRFTGRGLG